MSCEDTGQSSRKIPAGMLPITVAVVLALGYTLGSLLGWGGHAPATWVASWSGALAAGTAAAALLHAAHHQPDALRREAWRWYGVSAGAWCVGAAINAVSRLVLRSPAVALTFADLFFLIGLVALGVGFVTPVRLPRTVGPWLRYAADTYVCAAALFVVAWVGGFGDLYRLSGEWPADFLVALAFPLVEAVLVCVTLSFVFATPLGQRRSATTAYAALIALTAADTVNMAMSLRGEGAGSPRGGLGDLAEFVGLLLLGVAPWADQRVPAAETRERNQADAAETAAETAGERDGADSADGRDEVLGQPDGDDGSDERVRGWLVGPGLVPALLAAVGVVFVAGHVLSGTRMEPVVPVVGASAVFVVLVRLTHLMRENSRLRETVDIGKEHFRALAESINDVVLICDLDGTVRYVGAGASRICSHPSGKLLGHRVHDVIHPEDLPRIEREFGAFLSGTSGDTDVLRMACRVSAADGTWLPTESTVSRYAGSGDADRLLITTRDFSEQAALRRQVDHLTFNDGLTGLPNRAYFEERTREVLARRRDGSDPVAVVFLDLDGFTAVNDSAGHASGDQVLAQAARRLRAAVPVHDTVARWGGDEFAVLVERVAEPEALVDLAERLLRTLSTEPYQLAGRGVVLTASVGIALAGVAGTDSAARPAAPTTAATKAEAGPPVDVHAASSEELIRNADVALSRAKGCGGSRVEVFAAQMHDDVVRRLELGSDLQRALAERQFAVEFQPVVELGTARVTGVEALVRWWRSDMFVPPEDFIPPAEEFGLMASLGEWILRESCGQVARWRQAAWDIGLSVNLSPRQIAAPGFVESVAGALRESGLPPEALTLEVTEEVLVHDAGETIERLSALRDLGVRLAIDDFGTGYASLAYLGQLPVDVIKIDPSFVAGLGQDETLTLLTRTIVRLGRDLGLIVVAEGIERSEQLDLLREMGCPRGQGFLVARPMTPDGIESLVHTDQQGEPGLSLRGPSPTAPAH